MKVANVYEINLGLTALLDCKTPTRTSYKIQVNHQKSVDALSVPEKMRKELLEKYGSDAEYSEDFAREVDELMSQEADVEFKTIKLSELDGVSVSPRTLSLLEGILVVDDED